METKKYRSRIKAWAIFFWCIDTSIADTLTVFPEKQPYIYVFLPRKKPSQLHSRHVSAWNSAENSVKGRPRWWRDDAPSFTGGVRRWLEGQNSCFFDSKWFIYFFKKARFHRRFLSNPFIFSGPFPQHQAQIFRCRPQKIQSLRLKRESRRLCDGIVREASRLVVKAFWTDPSHCFAMSISTKMPAVKQWSKILG